MLKYLLLAAILLPRLGWSCGTMSQLDCERITNLVTDRMHAITISFGDLSPIMPQSIGIRIMRRGSPEYDRYGGRPGYDPEQHILFLPHALTRRSLNSLPELRPRTREYWSFYTDREAQTDFEVVHQLDAALWDAYLQEAAWRNGLAWPHPDCKSPDAARRLPCEMVAAGALDYVNRLAPRIFNANRIERIWPEDYAQFAQRLWRRGDREAVEVKRYGGLLLLRPLVQKLGVPRMLAYVAQTPFRVEHNDMRQSALRYQEHALRTAHAL